jgi:hypothetical protein
MKAMPQIFLSYAPEDEEKVERLYRKLFDAGFKPWMDKKDLLPGEQRQFRIPQAIRRSDFFVVCLSVHSTDKRGWIQREIKQALDIWQERLDSDIYLIPVQLEDCQVPERLRDFQRVNPFEEDGWTRLVEAIQVGMERLTEIIPPTVQESVAFEPSPAYEKPSPLEEGPERVQRLSVSTYILPGFVDRTEELALFHRMLAGETAERILRILERGEQGKTFFLLKLFHECEQQRPPMPVVLLDFDQRKSGLTDYLSVAREVRRYLGDDCTPAICNCEEAITRGHPPADVAKQRADMGRALCNDLAGLAASHRRIVLLIDTFEHALKSEDTCAWLERWLFEPLGRELRHVLLVVAGRPECQAFFTQPRLWSGLVARIDRFAPFSEDEIRDHYRQRGILISEEEMPLLLDLARPSPAMMAQIGDSLEQTRRGGGR